MDIVHMHMHMHMPMHMNCEEGILQNPARNGIGPDPPPFPIFLRAVSARVSQC